MPNHTSDVWAPTILWRWWEGCKERLNLAIDGRKDGILPRETQVARGPPTILWPFLGRIERDKDQRSALSILWRMDGLKILWGKEAHQGFIQGSMESNHPSMDGNKDGWWNDSPRMEGKIVWIEGWID